MKLFQLCISIIMLILAIAMSITQILSSSMTGGIAYAFISALMACLAWLSWEEFKAQE